MSQTSASWVALGLLDYDTALAVQQNRRDAVLQMETDAQTIYSVEHPPTITIGKNGSDDNILATTEWLEEQGFTVRTVDRGGDVTYHGPGQWVIYPVLHLSPWDNDVSLLCANARGNRHSGTEDGHLHGTRSEGLSRCLGGR